MATHHILFWIEKPAPSPDFREEQGYQMLLNRTKEREPKDSKIQGFPEGVWLLDRDRDTDFLVTVASEAKDRKLKYGVRYLSAD